MTLTNRQFKDLRNSCLYKAAFKLELSALAQAAMMQSFPPRKDVKRDRTRGLEAYECSYCRCFHVGHKGAIADGRPAFRCKGNKRKIVLAPSEIL